MNCKIRKSIGWAVICALYAWPISQMFKNGWKEGCIAVVIMIGVFTAIFFLTKFIVWCFKDCEQ